MVDVFTLPSICELIINSVVNYVTTQIVRSTAVTSTLR